MSRRVARLVLAAALSLASCSGAERAAEPPNETGGAGAPAAGGDGGEAGGDTGAANTGAGGGSGTGEGGGGAGTAVDPATGR